jgi:hypothetical protein
MAIRHAKPAKLADFPSRFHGVAMSAQKYLSLPEEKPYLEYIDGVVEQKPMVNAGHGRLVRRLDAMFDRHISAHGGDAGLSGAYSLLPATFCPIRPTGPPESHPATTPCQR